MRPVAAVSVDGEAMALRGRILLVKFGQQAGIQYRGEGLVVPHEQREQCREESTGEQFSIQEFCRVVT